MTISASNDPNVFERDKICYEQNFEQFRAMNQIMWQVPLLVMTLTGGLWYAAATLEIASLLKVAISLLSVVWDVTFIFVLVRVRHVMEAYLSQLRKFHPAGFVEASGTTWYNKGWAVVWALSIALGLAALFGLAGAISFWCELNA